MEVPNNRRLIQKGDMVGRRDAVKRRHALPVKVAGVLVDHIVVLIIENAGGEGKHPIGKLLLEPFIPFGVAPLKRHIDVV